MLLDTGFRVAFLSKFFCLASAWLVVFSLGRRLPGLGPCPGIGGPGTKGNGVVGGGGNGAPGRDIGEGDATLKFGISIVEVGRALWTAGSVGVYGGGGSGIPTIWEEF